MSLAGIRLLDKLLFKLATLLITSSSMEKIKKSKKIILSRKQLPLKKEIDYFDFAVRLFPILCSDYISMRILYFLEPITTSLVILPKIVEIAEKSLKIFLLVHKKTDTAFFDSVTQYGHKIEKLRLESVPFNPVFDDDDIKTFTASLCDDKLYQLLRYGSERTSSGMEANLPELMPIVDKIFFKSILLLPDGDRRLLNFVSLIKILLTRSPFDQTLNKDLVIKAISHNNNYIEEYLEYCRSIDKENKELLEAFHSAK